MFKQRNKGVGMFLSNLLRLNTGAGPAELRNTSNSVAETVNLPGYGIVTVGCRLACEGEGCPRPQLRTLKALDEHAKGMVIEIITDNPSVVETIPSMMDMFDGQHLATVRGKENWRIYVRREE